MPRLLILGFCSIFCLSLITTGCTEVDDVPELRFSVVLSQLEDFSAAITITHTGTNRVRYYAMAEAGDVTDIDAAIREHQCKVASGALADAVYDQKKRVVVFKNLLPETQYTCIVYGVDDDGEISGIPCSVPFKTNASSIEFSVNPKWKLTYCGQTKYKGYTYSQVVVDVSGDIEERYFVYICNKQVVDSYQDIRNFLLYAYKEFSAGHNETDDDLFWIEDQFVCTESMNYYKYLYKGRYQAFAIGVDADGHLTGHYAKSDVFDFDHYELEAEYAALLGEWEMVDEDDGWFYFTLSELYANSSLTMSGFGFTDCPFVVNYSPTGIYLLTIKGQSSLGTYWGEDDVKTMTLRPWYQDENDSFKIYKSQIVSELARSTGRNSDGSYTFQPGFNVKLNDDKNATTTGVLLTYYDENSKLFYYKSSKMKFPFTMRKLE